MFYEASHSASNREGKRNMCLVFGNRQSTIPSERRVLQLHCVPDMMLFLQYIGMANIPIFVSCVTIATNALELIKSEKPCVRE